MSVLAGLATSSCGSSRSVSTVSGHGKGSHSAVSHPSLDGLSPTAKILISEADSWVGTPYRYGGNDRGGVDCSGFVTQVYLKALGIKLPRSSREQSEYCPKIDKSRLTPGDLLFFRTTKGSNRVSHVGIFVGDNRMIHSSTSRGVIYTDITSDYYARAYAGAGKVE
ncbi:MAG: C40 family peptidase, partial [Duncaniella sp.]|nr:C40 family peptidase [Duncaniella sp.]